MPEVPFQVGDLAESRSFQSGYRGAWFRCKAKTHYRLLTKLVQSGNVVIPWKKITGTLFIRDIRTKNAGVSHLLEYYDYPDQKLSWIKLYQKPPSNIGKSKGLNKELMLRPSFPTVCHANEKLDVNSISEVIVIFSNLWKVGDLVDWYTDGCFWSGSVTEILGNDKVKINLLPPPLGQGSSYEALIKDLRPSLDWSLEKGWTVAMPMGGGCRQPSAHIVNPANSDGTVKVSRSTVRMHSSPSSPNLKGLSDSPDRSTTRREYSPARNDMDIDNSDDNVERACFPCNVSSSQFMNTSIENAEKATINGGYEECPTKKTSNTSLCLNSMSSNTIEAAIMDLEELVNKIKWLRGVLNLRVPLSDTKQPSWEISQHHAPCK